LTVIATHIEEAERRKRWTTPLAVDNATSMSVNRQRKGKKPLEDLYEGSSGTHPRRSERYKPSKCHEEKDSPSHHG